jgi:hypothetical protein
MTKPTPTTLTLCRYWVKTEKEAEFRKLLVQHWPTFERLGLVADDPPHLIFRGVDRERGLFYWRPIGPRRRSEKTIRKMFAPELELQEIEVVDFEVPFPFGPVVRGIGYWFKRGRG